MIRFIQIIFLPQTRPIFLVEIRMLHIEIGVPVKRVRLVWSSIANNSRYFFESHRGHCAWQEVSRVLRVTLPVGSHCRMQTLPWNLTCCSTTPWFGYCSGYAGGALLVQSERTQLQQVTQPAEHPGPRPKMPLLQV